MLLALADLEGRTEVEIKEHLIEYYSGDGISKDRIRKELEGLTILIAYESVGSWGCDSSAWFLLEDVNGNLFEVSGSHCSCYGFEGQWELEPSNLSYLTSPNFQLYTGGYDDDANKHRNMVKDYLVKSERPVLRIVHEE